MEAAYEGRFPADYLSSEQLLMHDLAACFWIGLKHCSVRTAVPNRWEGQGERGETRRWKGAGAGGAVGGPGASAARLPLRSPPRASPPACSPPRTLLCRATGASPELVSDREVAALVAMDWGIDALLRSAGLVN